MDDLLRSIVVPDRNRCGMRFTGDMACSAKTPRLPQPAVHLGWISFQHQTQSDRPLRKQHHLLIHGGGGLQSAAHHRQTAANRPRCRQQAATQAWTAAVQRNLVILVWMPLLENLLGTSWVFMLSMKSFCHQIKKTKLQQLKKYFAAFHEFL